MSHLHDLRIVTLRMVVIVAVRYGLLNLAVMLLCIVRLSLINVAASITVHIHGTI